MYTKEIRIKNRLTQTQLGRLAGLSQNYISQIENGHYKGLTIDKLIKLSEVLNVSPCILLQSLLDIK